MHVLMIMEIQGFGITAKSTAEARRLDPTGIAAFRQADIGEYLREVSSISCLLTRSEEVHN